jgi:bifunctional non-homologous end joining protein LigD
VSHTGARSDALAVLPDAARTRLRPAAPPTRADPMLATLTERRDLDDEWLLEHKLDGERCLAWVAAGGATLRTRSDRDVTATYPDVVAALAAVPGEVVLDGELVAVDGDAALGFERLQRRIGQGAPAPALIREVPVALWAFDVLHVDGQDMRGLELVDRQSVLAALVLPSAALRRTEPQRGDAARRFGEACGRGWEGLVAKRAASTYVAGRSRDWLKLKCLAEQELVVGGWTEPRGKREGLGALLLGYFENGALRYAGKVGTGFHVATLRDLRGRLNGLAADVSPFAETVRPLPPGTHWVRAELVAQIAFQEWTRGGRLRQPRFLGLRDDKPARDVVRERPSP